MTLGVGNGSGKQDFGNQPPIDDTGLDTEIQYRPLKLRKADTEIQCRHHISDAETIADAVFADAVYETSNDTSLCGAHVGDLMLLVAPGTENLEHGAASNKERSRGSPDVNT